MPSTPAPRIVSIASSLHQTASSSIKFLSLDEINDSSLGANALYARSKLAVILYIRFGLVEKVIKPNKDNIFAIATHPGNVHTDQQDQFKEAFGNVAGTALKYAVIPMMRNPDQGSLSTLWAATSPVVEEKNLQGVYVQDPGNWGGETKQAQDQELGNNLWKLSHDLIESKLGKDALVDWNA